jgi:beta-lactamase regulating signal transducer with metallopeptidase domain
MSVLLFAAECLAAATIAPLATRILAARVRQASLRHLVRLGGLAALLLLPLFAMLLPSELVLHAPAPAVGPASPSPQMASELYGWLLTGLAALWMAGTLVLLLRGFAGALALRALFRRGESHAFDAARLASWAAQAGLDGEWRLRLSAEIETPISWGIVRPTVLLPRQCANWDPPELDAAMFHELAHLHRCDGFAQALALVCCALYWPHPLVWAEAKALRADAEEAADDAVILSGVKQSDYADLLLRVAAGVREQPLFAGLELPMAKRSGLETRIQSILASNPSRSGVTKMQILKTTLIGSAAALTLALARPSFGADQQTPPPAAPSALAAPDARPLPQIQPPAPPSANMPADARPKAGPARQARRNRTTIEPPADSQIGETVAKAISEAHIDEAVARAMAGAHIDEKVSAALADAHISEKVSAALANAHISEKVAAALANAHIDEKIAAALKNAQIQIDDAMARPQPERAAPPPPPQ